jgi:hypothetical protein
MAVPKAKGFGLCRMNEMRYLRTSGIWTGSRRISLAMTDGGEHLEEEYGEDFDTSGIVLGDLTWRVEKLRLEEQNTKRFLKARPVFLPYEECCKWVQAFGRWTTEEDWLEWIAMGEKRNAYIPVSTLYSFLSVKSIDDLLGERACCHLHTTMFHFPLH